MTSPWVGRKRDPATAAVVSERSLALQKAGRNLIRTFLPPTDPPTSFIPTNCIKVLLGQGIAEQGSPVVVWDWTTSRLLDGVLESVNARSVKGRDDRTHRIDMALVRVTEGILKAFPACHVFLAGRMQDGRYVRLSKKAKVKRPHCSVTSMLRKESSLPYYVLDGFPVDEWGNRTTDDMACSPNGWRRQGTVLM